MAPIACMSDCKNVFLKWILYYYDNGIILKYNLNSKNVPAVTTTFSPFPFHP